MCVCVCVCVSVHGYFGTTGYEAAYEQYKRLQNNEIFQNNKAIFQCLGYMAWKTSEWYLHMLLTTFIQLDGRTYWLYTKIRRVSTHRFLKSRFLWKLECFSLVFGVLAFTVHSYSTNISHTCAHLVYTWQSVHGVPTQKAIQYSLETTHGLRHTVLYIIIAVYSYRVTSLSRGRPSAVYQFWFAFTTSLRLVYQCFPTLQQAISSV